MWIMCRFWVNPTAPVCRTPCQVSIVNKLFTPAKKSISNIYLAERAQTDSVLLIPIFKE